MLNDINLSDISPYDYTALSTTFFLLEVDAVVADDNKGTRVMTDMVSIFLSLRSFGIFLGENMSSF